jgi:SsrA-binding protein
MKRSKSTKAVNKKASFNYELHDELVAGIVLTGPEIKAIRLGQIDLTGAHIRIIGGEAFLLGGRINAKDTDPSRTRKLLLHRQEISRLIGKSEEKGLAIIPVKVFMQKGYAKVQLALGKGKKLHDKREAIKKKDIERERKSELRQNK